MGEDEPGHRSCSEHIPIELWCGRKWILDGGAWHFLGYDEKGLLRSLKEDSLVYTKCCAVLQRSRAKDDKISTSDMHDGGYMIPMYSKIGQGMKIHFEKLVNWHGKNELIPVYIENNIFNFFLHREVTSTETNNVNDADHCLAKKGQQLGNEDGRAVRS